MLEDFLTPLSKSITTKIASLSTNQWGRQLHVYTPANKEMLLELGDNNIQLAIVGVQEDRQNSGCAMAGEAIRHELYQLYNWHPSFKVADLGNIKSGNTQKDTYFAIKNVVANLIEQKIVPIIVGGTHDVSYGQFLGHCEGNKSINVVFFDEKIDLFHTNEGEKRQDYLYKMLTRQLGLLHFTHVGYQRYLIAPSMLDTLEKLHFECYSLGNIRANMREVEPIVRNAHMLSFDVAAIRQSDFPATNQASPHGFLGEEACQIARYAGLSNHVQSFGIYECNPTLDRAQQSVQVAAQMIWYFVDGFYGRTYELP